MLCIDSKITPSTAPKGKVDYTYMVGGYHGSAVKVLAKYPEVSHSSWTSWLPFFIPPFHVP